MAEIKRIFGNIPGIAIGATFSNRRELHYAGIHRPLQAGISGSGLEGADSVVVSGGYEDDKDLGNEIIYTGRGGKDPNSGKQVSAYAPTTTLGLTMATSTYLTIIK